jgi:hypothetical protein
MVNPLEFKPIDYNNFTIESLLLAFASENEQEQAEKVEEWRMRCVEGAGGDVDEYVKEFERIENEISFDNISISTPSRAQIIKFNAAINVMRNKRSRKSVIDFLNVRAKLAIELA